MAAQVPKLGLRSKRGSLIRQSEIKEAKEELERIRRKHGKLTRELLLEESRRTGTFFHDKFDWNDASAAEMHRLEQAGQIIAEVTIRVEKIKGKHYDVRYYTSVADPKAPTGKRVYVPTVDALANVTTREEILKRALAEAESWRLRYEELVELAEIVAVIRKTRAKLG